MHNHHSDLGISYIPAPNCAIDPMFELQHSDVKRLLLIFRKYLLDSELVMHLILGRWK